MIGDDKQTKKIDELGFTLVELLVTMSVFSISIAAIVGLFASAMKVQLAVLQRQSILNNISYSLEYMSRALRMAQKDLNGDCISKGYNFEVYGSSTIRFLNAHEEGRCEEFFLQNGQIMVEQSSDNSSSNLSSPEPLTSSKINVERLVFSLSGQSQEDNLQPRVTLSLVFRTKKGKSQEIRTQTTISQRNLDVQY